MQNSSKLQAEVDWLSETSGSQQRRRAEVIAWQMIRATINALVLDYNLSLSRDRTLNGERYRLQTKKTLAGYLFELKTCMDVWGRRLNGEGLLSDDLRARKRAFGQEWRRLSSQLKTIRNWGFHLSDFACDPDHLVRMYEELDAVSLTDLNKVLASGIKTGEAFRRSISGLAG